MSFRAQIEKRSVERNSNIVLAFDFPFQDPKNRESLYGKAEKLLKAVSGEVCAVKINHHLVLPLGVFDGVQKLISIAHDLGLMTIMDCKANDIGATNTVIAEYYYAAGFDALIANPFIGWEEGLEPVFDVAKRQGRGVIILVYMSHKGSVEGYGQTIIDPGTGKEVAQYVSFARKALRIGADGAIVGATYPDKIKEISGILNDKVPIYSPGIGAQGASVGPAIKAGSRYLIVGREIMQAGNPSKSAQRVKELARMVK